MYLCTIFVQYMKVVIAEKYKKYSDFILNIPSRFDDEDCEILKQKRNSVRLFLNEGKAFVVKRYKRVNWIQSIIYTFFRATKAERAYDFAREMRHRGIETPHEIAYIETKEHGLFTVGYFICEESKGREVYEDVIERAEFDHKLVDAVIDYIVFMHSKGVLHGDMNSANFLYTTDKEGNYHFEMIDTNRSHFYKGFPTEKQCLENLKRFTHRRDLYEYVIRGYARRRGWDEDSTLKKAIRLLDKFENRKIKL